MFRIGQMKRAAALTVTMSLVLGVSTVSRGQAPATTTTPKAKAKAKVTAKSLLDLNKATAAELEETLPGVGPATAKKIIAGRPYTKIEDLAKAGVSAKVIDEIKPLVTLGKPADEPAAPTTTEKAKAKTKTTVEKAKGKAAAGPLDLNKATAAELEETLPGVGPATAKKIIAGRPYAKIEDLAKAGVSAKVIDEIKPLVTLGKPAAEPAPATTTAASPTAPKSLVDLNKAGLAELESLPGVGPAHAKAIIAGRPYKTVDELEKVKGIGKARIEALRALVTAEASAPATASETAAPTTTTETAATKTTTKSTAKKKAVIAPKSVNINTASKEELDALPGIGPVKAQAIIDTRPFATIEDIMKVKGIKEGEFSKIKDLIIVK